jgi:hypothetical protein
MRKENNLKTSIMKAVALTTNRTEKSRTLSKQHSAFSKKNEDKQEENLHRQIIEIIIDVNKK